MTGRFVEIDREWAKGQLAASGYSTASKATMAQLIEAVNAGSFLDADALEAKLADLLSLARNHALEDMRARHEEWLDVKPGEFAKGDRVRVRLDAYDAGSATEHNGQRGTVVAAAREAHVRYEDGRVIRHSPDKIQKLA